jgi:hypothetical protein
MKQGAARMLEQALPDGRQFHSAGRAFEQALPDLLFQQPYRYRQGRLGHVQPGGRSGETQCF